MAQPRHKRTSSNHWITPLEPRLLMAGDGGVVHPAATVVDVQAVSVSTNLEAIAVPGDRGQAVVRVANAAAEPVDRTASLAIYATQNGVIDESSFLLGSRQNVAINLPVGEGAFADYVVNIAITQDQGIDQYVLVAAVAVDPQSGEPDEENIQNNTVADETALNTEFAFGGFAGRSNVTLSLMQGDGSMVSFGYKGSGGGRVIPGDGYFDLLITRASPTTSLLIKTAKGAGGAGSGVSTIRNINFQGAQVGSEPVAPASGEVQPADVDPQLTLDKLIAKATRLTGTFNAAGGVKVIQVAEADGATLNISASNNPADTLTLNLVQARNLSIDSQIPIKSITTSRWLDDDATADVIAAPSLGSLKIRGNNALGITGDFQADLLLSDAGPSALGVAQISGQLDGADWNITGGGRSLKVGSIGDADLLFGDNVLSVAASAWNDGSLAAQSLKTLKITGDFNADLTLSSNGLATLGKATLGGAVGGQWEIAGTTARVTLASSQASWIAQFGSLTRLTVTGEMAGMVTVNNAASITAGELVDLDLRATAGIASIRAAAMTDSILFLGVDPLSSTLPAALDDFDDASAVLGSVTLGSFSNSVIAAGFINSANLGQTSADNEGAPFGVAARVIDILTLVLDGTAQRLLDLDVPGDSLTDGDFIVRALG